MQQRRFILGTFGAAALITLGAALAPAAYAQSFPSKTIKFVVPFGPGSGTDTSARYFARKLQDLTGQAVVVENKPGANGFIAVKQVLTAPADGYTVFIGSNSTLAVNAALFKELPYDPVKDFAPVSLLASVPYVIGASASLPAANVKELVARAIHVSSPRKDEPFVSVNCMALNPGVLESELFGHERGAFTGAQTQRRGRFEQAEGGTLFLDEIGDMPFDLQTRLLRVLSDGQFYRVGGHAAVKAHVRVIAATHQNLEQRVKEGGFREDLFHRLNVIRLRLPALRERHEDVPMLTRHFLQQSARQLGVEPKRIAESALARLEQFAFPGNVRQLENICHWLTVMAPAQVISLQDLPPEVLEAPVYQPTTRGVPGPAAAVVAERHESPEVATIATVASGTATESVPQATAGSGATHLSRDDGAAPVNGYGGANVTINGTANGTTNGGWEHALESEAQRLLAGGQPEVWDALTRRFESRLIRTALAATHGRRMEAAQRLGIGRNTITRKIQELGLDAPDEG